MARPKKLNLDYFSHDREMRNNRKIKALRSKFGLEGYAIFNMLIETLAEKDLLQINYNPKELELLAGDFNIPSEKLAEIIEYLIYLELLKLDKNHLFCPSLDKRSKVVFDKRMEFLEDLRQKNRVSAPETGVSVIKSTQSKVKYSKVNKIKEKEKENQLIINADFENFRKEYPGIKTGYQTEFDNFKKKHKDYKEVLPLLLPALKKEESFKDLQRAKGGFVPEWKHLKTWLNQRCWEQEFTLEKFEGIPDIQLEQKNPKKGAEILTEIQKEILREREEEKEPEKRAAELAEMRRVIEENKKNRDY